MVNDWQWCRCLGWRTAVAAADSTLRRMKTDLAGAAIVPLPRSIDNYTVFAFITLNHATNFAVR